LGKKKYSIIFSQKDQYLQLYRIGQKFKKGKLDPINILEIIILAYNNKENMNKLLFIVGIIQLIGINMQTELNRVSSRNNTINREFNLLRRSLQQYELSILTS